MNKINNRATYSIDVDSDNEGRSLPCIKEVITSDEKVWLVSYNGEVGICIQNQKIAENLINALQHTIDNNWYKD